jgi:hypothetical protein
MENGPTFAMFPGGSVPRRGAFLVDEELETVK